MFKTRISRLKLVLAVLFLFLFASMAQAVGEAVSIDAHDTTVCTPSAIVNGTVTHINGTAGANIRFTLTNNTQGTNSVFTDPIQPSGTYNYVVTVPVATVGADSMTMMIEILDGGLAVLAADALNYTCPGVAPSASSVSEPQPAFTDGRINDWDTGNPVVLYGMADGNSRRLDIYAADSSGLILSIPASAIDAVPACPAGNTLILSDATSGISLWRLTARSDGICPFQLMAPATEASKTYVIIFDGLHAHTFYRSWEQ